MHPVFFSLICFTAVATVCSESSIDPDAFQEIYADSLEATEQEDIPSSQDASLSFDEMVLSDAEEETFEVEEYFVPSDQVDLTPTETEAQEEVDWGQSSFTDDVDLDDPTPLPPPPVPPHPVPPQTESSLNQELIIDLKNPVFTHGVITTEEGGVITGQGIRIQARKIQYANKIENGIRIQKIVAEGDLMLEYANRAFVGSRLEYDFIQKTGILLDGKTFVDIWFLGGDKIELKNDGSFYISNAFVTTCEDQENTWEIKANRVKITEDRLLSAKNIKFRFFKVPLFWLPAFKSNLKAFTDSPIRYKLIWDKGLGPRLTMRYRVFSWKDLNLFFRLDYRLKRGFGGALESEYYSPEGATTFVTRSYGAYDKTFPNEKGPHRYRLQGLYHTQSKDEHTQVHLTWDKLSDTRMVSDFRSDDFEINTQKRTLLTVMHQLESTFLNFRLQPRLNRFQSIDQELPLVSIGIRPFQLGNTGIISNNYVNTGYLDYVYANDLRHQFHLRHLQSSTHAFRMETRNELYRPFTLGHFTLTPSVGVIGIFYSNNPAHHPIGQGIFAYGVQGQTRLYKNYRTFRHLSEPYLEFQGLTSPTAHLSRHFYFDIYDGYDQLNQLRIGWRNSFFGYRQSLFLPTIFTDIFTYGYFGNRGFSQTFPKTYLNITWNRPSFAVRGGIAWNNEEHLWDYTNIATEWTINENIAFSVEFRHRSRFDWRKANHENFIVDVARTIPELLKSPLSDGRDTLLTRLFIRLAPKWNCMLQSRHGWGRKNEPRYNAGKIDLFTMLTCSWRLRLSYERMPNDNRFSGDISLVK
jgi:hypothetical protein